MKSAFKVTIEQDVSAADSSYYNPNRETWSVQAPNAQVAIRKALKVARANGFMKSRPLEVVLVERIARDMV